jgi:hypothetical protein
MFPEVPDAFEQRRIVALRTGELTLATGLGGDVWDADLADVEGLDGLDALDALDGSPGRGLVVGFAGAGRPM